MRFLRRSLIAASIVLAGCSTTPDPVYYLLPTPTAEPGTPFTGGTIAVREIALPLYARAAQVASLDEGGSVTLSDDHRWADEPARASTRAFVAALQQLTGAPIVAEPWPTSVSPAIRIDVAVDRFIGDIDGGSVAFNGQYRLVRTGGEGEQKTFTYTVPIDGTGYKALAAAHSRAIALLATEVAAQISGGV